MIEEAATELASPAKAKTPVVLKSKPKKLRSNKPLGPAAREGSLYDGPREQRPGGDWRPFLRQ